MTNIYGGHGPAILAVGWSFCTAFTILLALRVYVRMTITTEGGWALFWTVVVYVVITAEWILATVDVSRGMGNHIMVLEEAGELSGFLFRTWMVFFWYNVSVPLGKVPAISLLVDLHGDVHPKRRYLLHAVAISNFVFTFPNLFLIWFQCSPPKALWDPLQQDKCDHTHHLNYTKFLNVWSAVSDLIVALLPALMVWPLQMPRKLKLGISFLMGLGVFAALSSLMVVYYVKDITSPDASYDLSNLFIWGTLTNYLVLIAASVPPTWPLIKRFFNPAKFSGSANRHNKRSKFVPLQDASPRLQDPESNSDLKAFGGRVWYQPGNHNSRNDLGASQQLRY